METETEPALYLNIADTMPVFAWSSQAEPAISDSRGRRDPAEGEPEGRRLSGPPARRLSEALVGPFHSDPVQRFEKRLEMEREREG